MYLIKKSVTVTTFKFIIIFSKDESDCFVPALIIVTGESAAETNEVYHMNFQICGLPKKIFGHQSEYFLEVRKSEKDKEFGQFDLVKRTQPQSGSPLGE